MNRETTFRSSDTLVVVDRSRRQRMIAIAVGAAVILLVVAFLMLRGGEGPPAAAPGAQGKGQVPTVSVIVPGRTQVARVVTASGALAARRDQPVGIAGQGGRVTGVGSPGTELEFAL